MSDETSSRNSKEEQTELVGKVLGVKSLGSHSKYYHIYFEIGNHN